VTATRGIALILTLGALGVVAERRGAAAGGDTSGTVQLRAIAARARTGGASLVVETSEPTPYVTSRPDPLTILLDLRNVDAAGAQNGVGRVTDPESPVASVQIEPAGTGEAPASRIRVSLVEPSPYQVRSERNTIILEVEKPAPRPVPTGLAAKSERSVAPAVADPIAALGLGGQPTPSAAARLLLEPRPEQAGPGREAAAPPPGAAPAPALAAAPAVQAGQPAQTRGARTYTGNPISLDFQGADLRSVLRMFSEISGLNIVIDPAVQGSVDVMLTEVPWDQALDIILRANKLGYTVDGTIVRIAPLNVLADEESQRRKLTDEQALAGELKVLTRTLSYAKAEDLQQLITKSSLSQRGTVQVDPRTNTLILTDLQDRLATAEALITTLDRPQPQVEIEARIIQTTKDFARQLGIDWGFAGRADAALGNTTNFAFPNSATIGGRTGAAQGPGGQPTAVNLGVDTASSALGLALGSINGAFNLDVALSALERTGNGRFLSTPRISTQNNTEAEITQGIQVPIQTVANNTVTVTFKDAALTLKVTPQITAAGTVIMKIWVENAEPDFSKVPPGLPPPINTQRANTTVLVNDGQTTVIGGIYKSQELRATDRTPGLSRVPFLSWLFKRDQIDDRDFELLIFITPKITKA
jgi:type IV pilus assembly protein PilQ